LDKCAVHIWDDVVVFFWRGDGYESSQDDRPLKSKPEILTPRVDHPDDHGLRRKRWVCKCGAAPTVTLDRLTETFAKHAPDKFRARFDLRFGVEL
jgi:hypothetical protein